jgi:hypothetical protein
VLIEHNSLLPRKQRHNILHSILHADEKGRNYLALSFLSFLISYLIITLYLILDLKIKKFSLANQFQKSKHKYNIYIKQDVIFNINAEPLS